MQINFGVILNEELGDGVKITVIATGFQPENSPVPERRGVVTPVIKVRAPEPDALDMAYAAAPPAPAEPPPAPAAEPEPVLDLDDLDTPAYLRQGRLLN